ncbi:MAG: protein kinase [Myxococcota bacterium]|nr:protein kinase [Myxococcota bacterium]
MRQCPKCHDPSESAQRLCANCGTDLTVGAPESDPLVGKVLCDRYRLIALIGAGAMGRVYRAQHLRTEGLVAIKILSSQVSADPTSVRRFHREARAASQLRHPNSIRIYDFGETPEGLLYLVMELLSGRTLGQINRMEGPLPPARLARLLGGALLALEEAHRAQVIHRDFKPENIFVERLRSGEEQVKVLDFGIAKIKDLGDSGITHAGMVCGTPDYMSPEQIRGEELDGRSDVYAAGVVLYEMLTGHRPFAGSLLEVLSCHLSQAPEPPRKRRPDLQIPAVLERICLTAMSKRREDRYPSAAELARALEAAVRSLSSQLCPRCGEAALAQGRFCPWCGAALRSASSHRLGPRLPRWPEALVGRDKVLARLERLRGQGLVLCGTRGMGKSRMVEHMNSHVWGGRAIFVYPDPSGAKTPLWPIRSALAQALGISERPSLAELDQALRQANLPHPSGELPGLAELFGIWEAAVRGGYDVRRRECFAAALGTLRHLPNIYVFEDVDRYDWPSRSIVVQLCAARGPATVLLTTSSRAVLEAMHALEMDSSSDRPPLEVIELGALTDEALQALRLPPEVQAAGGGVPGRLELAFHALHEGARGATLADRLALLSEEARRLLEALAVSGTRSRIGLLCELAEVTDPRPALDELSTRGLVRIQGEVVSFPSAALRDDVHQLGSPEQLSRLHRRCWRRLEELGAAPTTIAYHALLADPSAVPLGVLERAGDAARHGFDDAGAEWWYRKAYARAQQLVSAGQEHPEVQVQAGLRLALTLRYAGNIVDAEQILREVLTLGRGDGQAEASARRGLARLAYIWDQPAAAQQELYEAIRAAWRAGDPQLLAELYLELADVMVRAGRAEAAERELREGIDSVTCGDGIQSEQGPVTLWRLLLRLAELLLQHGGRGRLPEALQVGRHALRWAEKSGSHLALSKVHCFLGRAFRELGDPQVAARHHELAVEEARLAGDRRSTAELLLVMADALQQAGRTPDRSWNVRALLQEASTLSQQVGWAEGLRLAAEHMASIEK